KREKFIDPVRYRWLIFRHCPAGIGRRDLEKLPIQSLVGRGERRQAVLETIGNRVRLKILGKVRKLFPGCRRAKRAGVVRLKSGLVLGVGEEVAAIEADWRLAQNGKAIRDPVPDRQLAELR